MAKWKIALEIFLKEWQDKEEVVGALVCGSYITGNPSKRSDIDVHIIWRIMWGGGKEGIVLLMVF